eukprot:321134_1
MPALKKCSYARCNSPAQFGFPTESEAMYCDVHKAEGMKDFLDDSPHDTDKGKDVKAEEEKQNYYDVLGVKKDASPTDIRRKYHKLALGCHPDKYPGDSEKEAQFRDISEAYTVLSDPEKRNVYDRSGEEGVASSEAFQGSFPEGFTVVNAKEMFRNQFGDADTGLVDDQTFFYEFLKTNTVTGQQEPAKAPVHVQTIRKGNKVITKTQMVVQREGRNPRIYTLEKTVTTNPDGTETVEEKEWNKELSALAVCCLSIFGCLYLLTCGCGCNFGCNCCFNGCCGILPVLCRAVKNKNETMGEPPTTENMDR